MKYPSDLTDTEWDLIKDFFVAGNKSKHDKRCLVNAVLYIVKSGCQWRMLPNSFPSWKTVYSFFRRATQKKIWETVNKKMVLKSRNMNGKVDHPTYAIIDSQSVKTTRNAQSRGIDGGKKNKGKETSYYS